ncbi:MAG: sulfate adenylyltransferase [Polyangiaceae bacterium]
MNEAPRAEKARTFIAPHGGTLVSRLVEGAQASDLLARAAALPKIELDARSAADAELIATGALSPLTGFVGRDDYRSIILDLRTASGAIFSIPITLGVPASEAANLAVGKEAALAVAGEVVGVIDVSELYPFERELEAKEVYKTTDAAHPGVAYLYAHKDEIAVAGKITLAKRTIEKKFPTHHRDPAELRALIAERGWKRTVAFQTRNPIHRAHEYLLRSALETVDGLVVHPLVGETKGDDVPAATRVRCYETLLEKYFPKERVVLSVFPFAMRYAGPREAVLHAIARQNYGFSHFIVGRDHAGVGNYYGTYDAQKLLDAQPHSAGALVDPKGGSLAITPIFFEHSFYCKGCHAVASAKTCPHDKANHLTLSGTKVRELLTAGEAPPAEYSRPEIAQILIEAYRSAARAS